MRQTQMQERGNGRPPNGINEGIVLLERTFVEGTKRRVDFSERRTSARERLQE